MRRLKYLAFVGVTAVLASCASTPAQIQAEQPSITRDGDTYSLAVPIASFSDFILVETQMGDKPPRVVELDKVINDLAGYDAVFIGEAHGHAASHYVQSKIFAGLHNLNPDMALSMEQFERPAQGVVDDYLAGKIGEETLVHDGKAWPHYRSSYRPLVEYAKYNSLPVIASEIPGNMVSCIGERGPDFLETLEGEPRTWAAEKLHLEDGDYKDKYYAFLAAVPSHSVGGDLSEAEKDQKRFYRYAAQVSRDDTMAESLARHMQANPGRKIMHINGSFHSAGMLGTPERLAMRIPGIKMANVHPVVVSDPANPTFDAKDVGEGQYLLLIYPVPKRFVQMKNINAFIKRTKDKIDENKCAY